MIKFKQSISIPSVVGFEVVTATIDKDRREIRADVKIVDAEGEAVLRFGVMLRAATKVVKTVDGESVHSFEDGICDRVIRKDAPYPNIVEVGRFASETAYDNARAAMKADDESAALEACAIADGWVAVDGVT